MNAAMCGGGVKGFVSVLVCVLPFFLIGANSWCAGGSTIEVKAEGVGWGTGKLGLERAIANGKEQAVRAVVEGLLSRRCMVGAEALVRRGEFYVRSLTVVEKRFSGGRVYVEVEALVLVDKLRQDLARWVLPQLAEPPTVLVMVGGRMEEGTGWSVSLGDGGREALSERLTRGGVVVMGAAATAGLMASGEVEAAFGRGVERWRKIGRGILADIVVVVLATSRIEKPAITSNLLISDVTIEVSVIRSADGRVLRRFEEGARVQSVRPRDGTIKAIEDACVKAFDEVLVSSFFGSCEVLEISPLYFTFESPGPRERFEAVVELLRMELGEVSLEEVLYTERTARYVALYEGEIKAVVEGLVGFEFDGFRVKAHVVAGRDLRFRVVGE